MWRAGFSARLERASDDAVTTQMPGSRGIKSQLWRFRTVPRRLRSLPWLEHPKR